MKFVDDDDDDDDMAKLKKEGIYCGAKFYSFTRLVPLAYCKLSVELYCQSAGMGTRHKSSRLR